MNPTSAVDLRSMRVDLVGSLLRPQTVKDAFAKYGEGSAREVDLKDAQDEAIRDVGAECPDSSLVATPDAATYRPAAPVWQLRG